MDDLVIDILLHILVAGAILTYAIHLGVFLPTIRKYRKVVLGEWLLPGSGYNWFSYLDEYKKICQQYGYPLIWHKIQWGVFISMCVAITVCFVLKILI